MKDKTSSSNSKCKFVLAAPAAFPTSRKLASAQITPHQNGAGPESQILSPQNQMLQILEPFGGFFRPMGRTQEAMSQAFEIGKSKLLTRRSNFAAVSASNPTDTPKKKRKRRKVKTQDPNQEPSAPQQETVKPAADKKSWMWWQNKKPSENEPSPQEEPEANQKKQWPSFSLPWQNRTPEEEQETDFMGFLDETEEMEPKGGWTKFERAVNNIAKVRLELSDEANEDLDWKIFRKIKRSPIFMVTDEDGKKRHIWKALEREKEKFAREEMSADEPQIQKISHEKKMDMIHGSKLRQDKTKMWLRPDEADELELDLLGKGHQFSVRNLFGMPMGMVHDFAWGIFGRIPELRQALTQRWAGHDPQLVLSNQRFYDEIMCSAPESELTILMVAHRPLSLMKLRNAFFDRHVQIASNPDLDNILGRKTLTISTDPEKLDKVRTTADFTKLAKEAAQAKNPNKEFGVKGLGQEWGLTPNMLGVLADLKKRWTLENFEWSGLIDEKGRVKVGSKLILTCGKEGQLSAEAVTPGTLAEQRTIPIFLYHDPEFTVSVLEHFFGENTCDEDGKVRVGNGALWVANGFDFRPPEFQENPNVFYASNDPSIPVELQDVSGVEGIPNSPGIFSLSDDKRMPMLLGDPDTFLELD